MKVIGPYVISAAPHLHREVMNGATGDGHIGGGHIGDRPDVNGQDNVQASPSVPAPAARQSGKNQKAQKQATQNQATRNQIPQNRSTWTFSPRTQASGPGGRKASKPDAAANLVLSALNALPLHGIDRLTGMPVLLHRLNEFVVPIALPDSPHLLPVTEVDIWDAHPYAVTELPPAAVLATHPATAALGVLRALTALHAAGQVHGGLNAGQFWQVGREVRLAGAGLPWQPGAGADADMHALGQALDTLGARPAVLLTLEQMTARQALSALEGAMQQPEPGPAVQPEQAEVDDAPLPQPALTRADLGWNGATDPQITPSGPGSSAGVPAAEVTWNRRKTDRAAPATMNQATMNQATANQAPMNQVAANQTMPDSRLEEAVAAEVAALTVIDPLPIDPASIDPVPAPTPAPLPYRSADDVIVIGEVLQASSTQSQAAQASPTANSGVPNGEPSDGDALHGKAPDEKAKAGEKVKADASREPGRASDPAPRAVLAPIRIGFTDLPEADVPADLPSDLPESPSEWTPQPSASAAPDLQMGRATRFTPAHVSESAPATSPSTNSGSPALNPAQRTQARHGQASQAATGSSAATGLSAGLQAASSPGAANRMQPLRIGWEEDHSWRVVKSGPEKRGALTRRFPVWVLALVLLMLLAGAAFWLLGRAGPPNAACCPVNFTVSGSNQSVQVRLVKAPPGSTLQPGAVIGTAPGLLNFPGVAGQYTLKFSAQGHAALTAAVTVPSGQPFAIVLK